MPPPEDRSSRKGLAELRRSLVWLLGWGAAIWTGFLVVDLYVGLAFPGGRSTLLWFVGWRLAGTAWLLGLLVLARRMPLSATLAGAVRVGFPAIPAAALALMTVRHLGLLSPYIHGLSIMVLFYAGGMPAPWRQTMRASLAIIFAFVATMGAAALFDPMILEQWQDLGTVLLFVENLMGPLATVVVASVIADKMWDASRQLAEQEAARSRLFINLSHDFRTPLAVVRAEAELLAAAAGSPRARAALRRIEANVDGLADLTDQLLELARIEAGRTPCLPVPCDVLVLAREVAAQLQPASTETELAVFCRGPRVVRADPAQVRRILANLVANAQRQVRPRGGSVEVSISPGRDPGTLVVDVADDGPGIPPERRATLFERFVCFDRDTGTVAGIGLALARELATLNGGALELLDHPRTTFRLTLRAGDAVAEEVPARQAPPAQEPIEPAARPAWPPVLVVEDNRDMGGVLARLLGDQFLVERRTTVAAACRTLEELRPAAILADVMLPDGTGYELLQLVRGRAELCETPVLLLSALGSPEDRARGLAAGADDYISKPFAADELRSRLVAAMRRADAHARALARQRHELLMEVHDGVSGSLSRALLQLDASGSGPNIDGARASLQEGMEEVRAIMSLLSAAPERWDELCTDVLRDMADACERAGLALTFDAGPDTATVVPAIVSHEARRIAREATTNILKHAQARAVHCSLVVDDGAIRCRVEDDGRGMGNAPARRGLTHIVRRAERSGGRTTYGDRPEGGAFVEVTLPLHPPIPGEAAPALPDPRVRGPWTAH